MGKKEKLAKEYANWRHKEVEEYLGQKCDPKDMYYRNGDIMGAFEAGWDAALSNQWISVEEQLPEYDKRVLTLYCRDEIQKIGLMRRIPIDVSNDNNHIWRWSLTGDKYGIIAWMPIPSFDEILEQSKDALKRLKDK